MRKAGARWTLSFLLLAGSGVLLIGVGIYFLFVRPSLLPEDIRFMKLTPAELQLVKLGSWLVHVFRVMGGYIAATGVLAITLAATSFRDHHPLRVHDQPHARPRRVGEQLAHPVQSVVEPAC